MLRTHRNNLLGEKTLAKYNSRLLTKYRAQKKMRKTFGGFIGWVRSKFANEIQLRNWLKVKGGRIADYPKLLREYSKKNLLPPTEVAARTSSKVWWKCSKGHEWLTTGSVRIKGVGCQACAGRVATSTNNLAVTHPHLAREYSEKNSLPANQVVATTQKKLWWKCAKGHEWPATGAHRAGEGTGCPYCLNQRIDLRNCLATTHSDLAAEYSDRNPLKATEIGYGSNKKVWWRCRNGHEWQAVVANRAKGGNGCRICKRLVPTANHNLAILYPRIAAEYSDRNSLPVDRVMPKSHVSRWWKCVKGHEWQTAVSNRTVEGRENGCPYCSGRYPTPENNLAVTHPHLAAEYSSKNSLPVTGVLAQTNKLLWWECTQKHKWRATGNYRVQKGGRSCPKCFKETSFTSLHPDVAKEYSSRNKISVKRVLIGSRKRVWWECSKGHQWRASVKNQVRYHTPCPVCAKRIAIRGRHPRRSL